MARTLPQAEDRSDPGRLEFRVEGKGFAWTLTERAPGQKTGRRQPVAGVLAVRCRAEDKPDLLASDPETLFETDHYRGYPAVLVRLERAEADMLAPLLEAAWRASAPRALVRRQGGGG